MTAILFLGVYTGIVIWVTRIIIDRSLEGDRAETDELRRKSESLINMKQELAAEKQRLSQEEARIFTLYDLTREMTRSFSEERTFETFKAKLAESAAFTECRLLDPLSQEEIKAREGQGAFLLPLSSQRLNLGVLVINGAQPEDRDKVGILADQFALALRRVRLYQDLERLAITDGLTDVHTRRYVMERFEEERLRARARKTSMAFLMVDIDFFKSYNDKFGHLTGDQLLREIALIIKAHIREIDIIGRYGGEEFCVVLPETDRSGAGYVAERIRAAVETAVIKAYDTTAKATVSIGIAVFPRDGKTTAELVDKADQALYRAKKDGRNRVCF